MNFGFERLQNYLVNTGEAKFVLANTVRTRFFMAKKRGLPVGKPLSSK
jgi:hypothetical protein